MPWLVLHATVLPMDDPLAVLEDHGLAIEGDTIVDLAPSEELRRRYPNAETIWDARGRLLLPGSICAHTHIYGLFARGMAIPGPPPRDFPDILRRLWWPLDQALDQEAVRLSAWVMAADAIRKGTTTLIDHHASPNALEGSLDLLAEVLGQAGLRAVLAYEITDRYGPEKVQAALEENLRFYRRVQEERPYDDRLRALVGLHASMTLSEETLRQVRRATPEEAGFHIHVAEHPDDEYDSLYRTGFRVVERLHNHGLLGPNTIVAHAVHVDAREMRLLAETGTWVSHQPRSNMNNGVGVAQVESMMRLGVRVALGTDGFPHAMWEELRFAFLLPKVHHLDPRQMPGDVAFAMLYRTNVALASQLFGRPVGVLRPGAVADFILVDYPAPTPLTPENLPWHILYGFHEAMVTDTVVAGRALMRDRRLLTIDEAAVLDAARAKAPEVWARYRALVEAGQA